MEAKAILPPIVPGKIVAIGRSYADHARELGNEVPQEPLLFLKSPSTLVGHGDTVWLPPESESVHFEGEIALVVGQRLKRATQEEAKVAIWGVTAACDVTARDIQRGDRTFTRGKNFDTFCPLGPCIDDALNLEELQLTTRVNGEIRQQGRVEQLLWPFDFMLSYISRYLTLEPGDVVLTGTPPGVGEIHHGDQLEVDLSFFCLSNPVRALKP